MHPRSPLLAINQLRAGGTREFSCTGCPPEPAPPLESPKRSATRCPTTATRSSSATSSALPRRTATTPPGHCARSTATTSLVSGAFSTRTTCCTKFYQAASFAVSPSGTQSAVLYQQYDLTGARVLGQGEVITRPFANHTVNISVGNSATPVDATQQYYDIRPYNTFGARWWVWRDTNPSPLTSSGAFTSIDPSTTAVTLTDRIDGTTTSNCQPPLSTSASLGRRSQQSPRQTWLCSATGIGDDEPACDLPRFQLVLHSGSEQDAGGGRDLELPRHPAVLVHQRDVRPRRLHERRHRLPVARP